MELLQREDFIKALIPRILKQEGHECQELRLEGVYLAMPLKRPTLTHVLTFFYSCWAGQNNQ
jgi:hypothetical protein